MSGNSCQIPKAPNGKVSQLYKDLQSLCGTGGHSIANYLYAQYKASNTGETMEEQGFERNSQGEHSAKDVYQFLGAAALINDAKSKAMAGIENGKQKIYNDASTALWDAYTFNQAHVGRVASVVMQGENFQIVTEEKDSRTQIKAAQVSAQMAIWEELDNAFKAAGINLLELNSYIPNIANPLNVSSLFQYLWSLKNCDNDLLNTRDVEVLLTMGSKIPQVQNLFSRGWGTTKEVAQKIVDSFNDNTLAQGTKDLINNVLTLAKNYPIDLNVLKTHLNQISKDYIESTEEGNIQKELDILQKKYGINTNILLRTSRQINTLSDAAAEAALVLQRQIKHLERNKGITPQGRELEKTLSTVMKEIEEKRYYSGLLSFLSQAVNYATQVQSILQNISNAGTRMEYVATRAAALAKAKIMQDSYFTIVQSILNIDSIIIDESMSQEDKENLKGLAEQVQSLLQNQTSITNTLKEETMLDACTEILGETDYNGLAIANLLQMQSADSSMYDYLYSMSRVSNPLVGAVGTLIREAQEKRNEKLMGISLRIRRATNRLYQSGSNTEFMFSGGHILSDIVWDEYNRERTKALKYLLNKGLKGLELKEAITAWEEANTEERVVDTTNGRTERVPNALYQDSSIAVWDRVDNKLVFRPGVLTEAQEEYYNTIMQLKGELGSLLPSYARKQYLPAQVRASWLDIVTRGIKGKLSMKQVAKSLFERMKIWKIKEDDSDYSRNGFILNNEEFTIVDSDFDGTPLKQIPIFYVNPLENQDDLMKDFSSSLQSLAATACNYDAMSKIKDTVNFMADYISNLAVSAGEGDINLVDSVSNGNIRLAQLLRRKANASRTAGLLSGFVEYHIYGEHMKDTSTWATILKNFIAYNTLKSLALNVKGGIANATMGELQNIIEAAGGKNFNIKDLVWAHGALLGNSPRGIMEALSNNKNAKVSLLVDKFDPVCDNYAQASHERYYRNVFRKMFGSFNPLVGYSSGEYIIHVVNMYAALHHQKVYINGKEANLFEALEVVNKEDGNSELRVTPGTTIGEKRNGHWEDTGVEVDENFLSSVKAKIRDSNQNCHGSMNEEDKGIIQSRILGKLVMQFRQWMVEHYSRRYRKMHWDGTAKDYVEGYTRTTNRFIWSWVKGLVTFQTKAAIHWKDLSPTAKENVRKCLMENFLFIGLTTLSLGIGDPDERNKGWWQRMWMYQVNRMLLDTRGSVNALGVFYDAKTLINSPIASINTLNGLCYPIYGLLAGDLGKKVQRGDHKGWNKYLASIYKYTLPFGYQIEQIFNMGDDETIFRIFDFKGYK